MGWLLVFYVAGVAATAQENPAIASFESKPACERAGQRIKETWPGPNQGFICIQFSGEPK